MYHTHDLGTGKGGAAIVMVTAGDGSSGQGSHVASGYRVVRLVVLLVAFLAALLVLRVLVVAVVNSDRLSSGKLDGLRFHGRYYPVEKVCLVVDDGALEKGLSGSSLDRGTFSLLATGNGFNVIKDDRLVNIDCGWKNWEYDTDPEVFFQFSAVVHTDRITQPFACRPQQPDTTAETVSLGRYRSCRTDDGFETGLLVTDDNAAVSCQVKSRIEALRPALERAMRPACVGFLDRLASSRPITYPGSGFWTVR